MKTSASLEGVRTALDDDGDDSARLRWHGVCLRIERAHAEHDWRHLAGMLEAMSPRPDAPGDEAAAGGRVADAALRALALVPGESAARATLSLADRGARRAALAAALASTHPVDLLARLCSGRPRSVAARALLAAWMHESVYHGARPLEHAPLVALAGDLRDAGEPLGRVPLVQTALEAQVAKVPPAPGSRGDTSWGLMPACGAWATDARGPHSRDAVEVTSERWAARIGRAFHAQPGPAHAKIDARRYLLGPPAAPTALGAPLLRALAPDCVTGAARGATTGSRARLAETVAIRVRAVTPVEALGCLLHFAIGAGCCGEYAGVGPGRARAYDAAAAVCDLGPDAPWAEVEAAFRAHAFVRFEADSTWFDYATENFGLAALDPAGNRVVVIAQTDAE